MRYSNRHLGRAQDQGLVRSQDLEKKGGGAGGQCICRHASAVVLQLAGIDLQDGIFMER